MGSRDPDGRDLSVATAPASLANVGLMAPEVAARRQNTSAKWEMAQKTESFGAMQHGNYEVEEHPDVSTSRCDGGL